MHKPNQFKAMRAEIKRLQCSVAHLAETNEIITLKMKQQEGVLAKRRTEVATLHQACAKYKRDKMVSAHRSHHLATRTVNSPTSIQAVFNDVTMEASQEITTERQLTSIDLTSNGTPHIVDSKSSELHNAMAPLRKQEAGPTPSDSEPEEITCKRCLQVQAAMRDILETHDNLTMLMEDANEYTRKTFRSYDAAAESSRQTFAQLMTESHSSYEAAAQGSSQMFAQFRTDSHQGFEQIRRQIATPQQYDHETNRRILVIRRRTNGTADAG